MILSMEKSRTETESTSVVHWPGRGAGYRWGGEGEGLLNEYRFSFRGDTNVLELDGVGGYITW